MHITDKTTVKIEISGCPKKRFLKKREIKKNILEVGSIMSIVPSSQGDGFCNII
jgi:hypothetical protein